jgi:hypothetical protein
MTDQNAGPLEEERLRDLMRLQRFADEWRRAAQRTFR